MVTDRDAEKAREEEYIEYKRTIHETITITRGLLPAKKYDTFPTGKAGELDIERVE